MGPMATAEQPLTIVSLTESAATKIRDLMAEEPEGEATVLRIAVQGGGSSDARAGSALSRADQA